MIIDFHAHIFPDKIASSTIEKLENAGNIKACTDGTLSGLIDSMKTSGVDYSLVSPVVTKPSQFESVNKFAAEINRKNNIFSFGGIHPDNDNIEDRLDYIKSLGLSGIKLHPDYQSANIDDERYIRIIKYCIKIGLYVLIHAGFDIAFPDFTHCTPEKTLKMLELVYKEETNPKTYIIMAHLGGNEMWDNVERFLVGKNVYFDTSFILSNITKEQLVRIISNHGSKKIIFGTDSPWADQSEFVKIINDLQIDLSDKKAILGDNARLILGI